MYNLPTPHLPPYTYKRTIRGSRLLLHVYPHLAPGTVRASGSREHSGNVSAALHCQTPGSWTNSKRTMASVSTTSKGLRVLQDSVRTCGAWSQSLAGRPSLVEQTQQLLACYSPTEGIQQDTVHGREVHHYISGDVPTLSEPQVDSRTAVIG